MTFRDAVLSIAQGLIKPQTKRGKAANINVQDGTMDVQLDGELYIHNVKLKATTNATDKGIVVVPKDGTMVTAVNIGLVNADWHLLHTEEVESVLMRTDSGSKYELKNDGTLELNGSKYGSLIKIQELVNKLNAMEQAHNNLVQTFNAHVHTGGYQNANTGTSVAQSTASINPLTQVSDIENNMVKHGDNN